MHLSNSQGTSVTNLKLKKALSPDLFKIFISDLYKLLEIKDCPSLSNIPISHLLWADDLILLALTPEAAKKQLNILANFCNEWGIDVNQSKTKCVVFGNDKNNSNTEPKFYLQDKLLENLDSYCYLGILLHKSGELRSAQASLKLKAMRAVFGLKRTIIRSKITFKAAATLFDSLIKTNCFIWRTNVHFDESHCQNYS